MRLKMFCAEFDSSLHPAHGIEFRAWEVRRNVAIMFEPGELLNAGWDKAKKRAGASFPFLSKRCAVNAPITMRQK